MPSPLDKLKVGQIAKDKQLEAQADAAVAGDVDGFKDPVEAKPIETVDLEDLNETTLLKYNIEGKVLSDPAAMQLKPKDKGILFKWVYYNNMGSRAVGSRVVSVARRNGFQFATVDDIEGGEDALVEGIIDDGGKILNYDTVLMKINKLRLMQHYKASLLVSMKMVDRALSKAADGAKAEVASTSAFKKAMETHPDAKVEFYPTSGG